jgi:hypothetical protein
MIPARSLPPQSSASTHPKNLFETASSIVSSQNSDLGENHHGAQGRSGRTLTLRPIMAAMSGSLEMAGHIEF